MRPGNLSESSYLTWHPLKTVGLSSRWKEEASEFIVAPGDVARVVKIEPGWRLTKIRTSPNLFGSAHCKSRPLGSQKNGENRDGGIPFS